MEKFYPIPLLDNAYGINPGGRRLINYETGHILHVNYKDIDNSGYVRKTLVFRGRSKNFRIHILVYNALEGNVPKGYVIDHKGRNKFNNHIDNLRCVTQSDNTRNATRHGHLAVSLIKDGESWNFKTLEATAKFLVKITGKSHRHCIGELNKRQKEIHGFTVIYADEIPEFCPKQQQEVIQLTLF